MNSVRCCGNCVWANHVDNGSIFCRVDPPQVVPVTGTQIVMLTEDGQPASKGQKGNPVPIVNTSGFGSHFPRVEPDWLCSKHSGIILPDTGQKKLLGVS
jgi:hypothetical protein